MLTAIADFVSKNPMVVIFAFMLSLLANVIQVGSYFKQKRFEGAYDEAFQTWEKNLKGKYTDQQIKELTEEMSQLQEKISSDIPNQAKRVFLEEQIHSLTESVSQSYSQLEKLSSELNAQPHQNILPAKLQQAIEANIMPVYLEKQRRQELIYWLVLASFAFTFLPLAISFATFPLSHRVEVLGTDYPTRWLWQLGIGVLIWSFVVYSQVKKVIQKIKKTALAAITGGSWVLSLIVYFIFLVFSTTWANWKQPPTPLTVFAIILFVSIPIAVSLVLSVELLSNIFINVIQHRRAMRH